MAAAAAQSLPAWPCGSCRRRRRTAQKGSSRHGGASSSPPSGGPSGRRRWGGGQGKRGPGVAAADIDGRTGRGCRPEQTESADAALACGAGAAAATSGSGSSEPGPTRSAVQPRSASVSVRGRVDGGGGGEKGAPATAGIGVIGEHPAVASHAGGGALPNGEAARAKGCVSSRAPNAGASVAACSSAAAGHRRPPTEEGPARAMAAPHREGCSRRPPKARRRAPRQGFVAGAGKGGVEGGRVGEENTQIRETTLNELTQFGPQALPEWIPAPPPATPQRAATRPGRAERGHARSGTRRRLRRHPLEAAGEPPPGPHSKANSANASATTTDGWGTGRPRRPRWPPRPSIKANRPLLYVCQSQGAPPWHARAQPVRT